MRALLLLPALMLSATAAAADVHRLTWDVTVAGQKVGERTATITIDRDQAVPTRTIEAVTDLRGTLGSVSWRWRQRLTVFGADTPDAFRAILEEDGRRRELQAGWTGSGWRVTQVDKAGARTEESAAWRIDLSTADLIDPGSPVRLSSFETAKVLSAETGDVWEGKVEALGPSTVDVAGTAVPVQGWSWASPEGRQSYWYDADGWLVRFETRVMGVELAGTLSQPPPRNPDAFLVAPDAGPVDATDL